jgi:hypothetical protein
MLRIIRVAVGIFGFIGVLFGFIVNMSPNQREGSAGSTLLLSGTAFLIALLISLTMTEPKDE